MVLWFLCTRYDILRYRILLSIFPLLLLDGGSRTVGRDMKDGVQLHIKLERDCYTYIQEYIDDGYADNVTDAIDKCVLV